MSSVIENPQRAAIRQYSIPHVVCTINSVIRQVLSMRSLVLDLSERNSEDIVEGRLSSSTGPEA